jgi:hypothetical protein
MLTTRPLKPLFFRQAFDFVSRHLAPLVPLKCTFFFDCCLSSCAERVFFNTLDITVCLTNSNHVELYEVTKEAAIHDHPCTWSALPCSLRYVKLLMGYGGSSSNHI